jgi:glycerol dehydrogenase-like iron-containing ADH family enzyme
MWLEKKLAPFTAPPPAAATAAATTAAAAAINKATMQGLAGANNSANCFDLSVLRETPTYDLPRSCGGTKPD